MSVARVFVDSNVLLYLLSADANKADAAESVLQRGAIISVQVLNEVTNVCRRKLKMSWAHTKELLGLIGSICSVQPLQIEMHERGLHVAKRYGLGVYDAMIVASALLAECDTLYSEDMQDGLTIDKRLKISNPFAAISS